MRSGWTTSDNYMCFDVGPLGSGHWHQDKLNLVLSAYGKRLLFDSGGGEYESSIWRTYGTSTWSHNTVIGDGNNQVGSDGSNSSTTNPDHITQSAQTWRWETDVAHDFAAGTYNKGYSNFLLRPATHTRRGLFVKPDLYLVADTLVGNGLSHTYQARWHLLPNEPCRLTCRSFAVILDPFATQSGAGGFSFPLPHSSSRDPDRGRDVAPPDPSAAKPAHASRPRVATPQTFR